MTSCEERGTDLPALPARKAPQLAYHARLKFLRILEGVDSHLHFGPVPGLFSVMQKEGHYERGVDGTDTAGNGGLQGRAAWTKGGAVRGSSDRFSYPPGQPFHNPQPHKDLASLRKLWEL